MPNCFQLFRQNDPTNTAIPLNTIDEEIAAHMGMPVDDHRYCCEWYNTIGWIIAVKEFHLGSKELRDELGKMFKDDNPSGAEMLYKQIKVLHFMEREYRSTAFYASNSTLRKREESWPSKLEVAHSRIANAQTVEVSEKFICFNDRFGNAERLFYKEMNVTRDTFVSATPQERAGMMGGAYVNQ